MQGGMYIYEWDCCFLGDPVHAGRYRYLSGGVQYDELQPGGDQLRQAPLAL